MNQLKLEKRRYKTLAPAPLFLASPKKVVLGEDIVHAVWKHRVNMNKARLAEAGRGLIPNRKCLNGIRPQRLTGRCFVPQLSTKREIILNSLKWYWTLGKDLDQRIRQKRVG